MKNKRLPKFLQSALWSYDLSKFNLEDPSDKRLIISNVLNHGTDEQVKWILSRYAPDEIRQALKTPSRGFWWPESLNYWVQVFGVKLPREKYEKAIQNIYPQTQASRGA